MTLGVVSRMGIPARLVGVGQECPTYKNKSREVLGPLAIRPQEVETRR